MNKCIYIVIFLTACSALFSQSYLHDYNSSYINTKSSDAPNTLIWGSILLITPTLVLEDGKANFGLSKEISLGKFPYGRAEFDYTYAFRNERTSLIHLSYNLDIPTNLDFNQSSLFMFSPGAGYYTDFTRKGFYVQAAFGLWASTGFSNSISIHPNIKARKTFMQDNQPGVFEISIGVGFGFYSK